MLNIISFLLIVLASVICMKSADMPNQLLNLGVIILAGYSLGTLARHLRLPAVTGYVIAGIMLSADGLGFLSDGMTTDITVIESVFFMLLIARTMEYTCRSATISGCLYSFGTGMLGAVLVMAVSFGMLRASGLSLGESLLYSLFTATFAPVMFHATDITGSPRHQSCITGGFVCSFIMWSVVAAIFDPEATNRLRTALAPPLVALTSVVAGIVWGLATEFALIRPGKSPHTLHTLTALFLVYPLAGLLGLDTIFIGAGFGIYAGHFSSREHVIQPGGLSTLAAIIVFSLFGARLSLEDAVMLGADGWRVVGMVTAASALGRLFSWSVTRQMLRRAGSDIPSLSLSALTGPLVLVMVHRFGPALSFTALSAEERPHDLAVTTTTMLLIATLIPAGLAIYRHLPIGKRIDRIDNS